MTRPGVVSLLVLALVAPVLGLVGSVWSIATTFSLSPRGAVYSLPTIASRAFDRDGPSPDLLPLLLGMAISAGAISLALLAQRAPAGGTHEARL